MSKKETTTDPQPETQLEEELTEKRTTPFDVGAGRGDYILSGWDGLYWVFEARVERFDVTYDGVIAIGLTFPDRFDLVEVKQVVKDMVEFGPRRLEMIPAHFWARGDIPEQPLDPQELNDNWVIKFFRGAGEKDSTKLPEYLKREVANYKKKYDLSVPRGRKKGVRIIRLEPESIDEVISTPEVLSELSIEKIEALQKTLDLAKAARESSLSASSE